MKKMPEFPKRTCPSCGHLWSYHDEEGCKPPGWNFYSQMFCACMAPYKK